MSKDSDNLRIKPATMPAGGWGSVREVAHILVDQRAALKDSALLAKQNKPDGFACVSCAWCWFPTISPRARSPATSPNVTR